ncbi:MAG TPA: penicillin acylase family protein [Terriglobales bacterium]|nr:penicillin acylase family protein [Terriglobales bacterium]
MATATVGNTGRSARIRAIGIVVGVLLALTLAIAVSLCAIFVHAAHTALPQVDGSISLAGLGGPVTVIRDARGVPHIQARNADDLFFAQGYVTAQDRLWQMDMSRRYSAGELAEILGPSYLGIDEQQRILRLRPAAEKESAALSAGDRQHFEAYARGVNAYIAEHRDRLPLEFRVLRYAPRTWTPADSLLCGILMTEMLNGSEWQTKLARETIARQLSPDLMGDLYPTTSWRDHPPGQPQPNWDEASPSEPRRANSAGKRRPGREIAPVQISPEVAPFAGPDEVPAVGSNNWVISGAHTASGKPLLSNDMHLGHRIPNVWYEAQLTIAAGAMPTFDVAGFTLPGLPYVVVGHNQRIAWGFSNIMPDVQDVYVETVNDRGEYLTPQGWKPLDAQREVIHVKGQPDVVLTTRATRHGPIVSDLVAGEQRTLALRWTLYEQPPTIPFFDVGSAQNWNDFCRAFAQFTGPGQNVVYADADGHIGYHATGSVPLRRNDALVPVNGADDLHEWSGYIPFDKMPAVLDPPSGIIATANSRITPDQYPYTISTSWDGPPYRTQRIYRLLSADRKFTTADMLAIQTDIFSSYDLFLAQRLTYAIDHAKNATREARAAADVLRGWDGRVTPDSSAPTIVAFARRQLWRLLLEPHLGAAASPAQSARGNVADTPKLQLAGWTGYRWPYSAVALENIVERQPERWLPPQFHSYDDLLAAAVNEGGTRETPRRRWQWGERFPLSIQHPIFGSMPLLRHWSGPGTVPQAGDAYTIKAAGPDFGPSERMTVDFADLDHSTMNIVTGESGNLLSANYMDQWTAWYGGTTFAFPFSPAAVNEAKAHQLTLTPAK